MNGDESMDQPPYSREGPSPAGISVIQQTRSPSPLPSCVSMKSDQSKEYPPLLGEEHSPAAHRSCFQVPVCVSMEPPADAAILEGTPMEEYKPPLSHLEMQQLHKSSLQKKFWCLIEAATNHGNPKPLNEIYTELYITHGGEGWVNKEHEVRFPHEVRQIERESWRGASQDRTIKCSDIFKPLPGQLKPTRTVLTKGVAGIGKTVSVQKFILDWAEGKSNQDVDFIFPLPFREMNLMIKKKMSLVELIDHFFSEIKNQAIFTRSQNKVLFIFDGLDECRLPLDFISNQRCCDVTEPASVDLLLTSLIKCNLLPSALIWITSRPAAAKQISKNFVDQETEVRGFSDLQKEEYFRKRISDENLASRTITHLKLCRSLYIMCHIPVFCWISATVIEGSVHKLENVEIPRTLTQMYTYFLIVQTSINKEKYTERKDTDEEIIFKLGKVAFQQLEKGNVIFYEEDLRECGIDVAEASVYSGVCTQIFREESRLCHGRVFSFVHLSIQEFLAALYVFLCFSDRQKNKQDQQQSSELSALFRAKTLHELYKTAVDCALQSENGHLDLFLRFLLGLSLDSNQNLLKHLLPQTRIQSQSSEKTVQYIKQQIRHQDDLDRVNLFYCLNELNHHAVIEVTDTSTGALYVVMLLPGSWKTRKFEFKTSQEQLKVFDLQKYIKTPQKDQTELLSPDQVLQKLMHTFSSSISVKMDEFKLTEKSCFCLASALTSHSCSLRLLEVSGEEWRWREDGVQDRSSLRLTSSDGCHPNIKPTVLRLDGCKLTEGNYSSLLSALTSHPSCLTGKYLECEELELLLTTIFYENCKVEELRLNNCNMTEQNCFTLASALTSHASSLRLLDMSSNELLDSGVQLLCSALSHENHNLEILKLAQCNLTEKSCSYLASALTSHSSNIKQLDLSLNDLPDLGTDLYSALCHQNCKLQTLVLGRCNLTEKSCYYLAPVLTSHSSSLKQLKLSFNDLLDSGVELLCSALRHQNCKLEELQLAGCRVTEKSCEIMASVLQSANSLIKLDLSDNDLGDCGIQLLSQGLSSPHCKLQTLRLCGCLISEEGCGYLASSLTLNPSHLKELNLSYNHPGTSGLKLLSDRIEDPHCDLEILKTPHCAEIRLRPGVQKYTCKLTLDTNTAGDNILLSEGNRKGTLYLSNMIPPDLLNTLQPYPPHPERFDKWGQTLCREPLTDRCYWECEWDGPCGIAVVCKNIQRKGYGNGYESRFGYNYKSWILEFQGGCDVIIHNKKSTEIPAPHSRRVGVYLNREAGTLSFYSVSSDALTHLHTVTHRFTDEKLCAGFLFYHQGSVCLC